MLRRIGKRKYSRFRKFFLTLTSRGVLTALIILVQIAFVIGGSIFLSEIISYYFYGAVVVSFMFGIYLLNQDLNPAFKTSWLVVIILINVAGVALYFMLARGNVRNRRIHRYIKRQTSLDVLLQRQLMSARANNCIVQKKDNNSYCNKEIQINSDEHQINYCTENQNKNNTDSQIDLTYLKSAEYSMRTSQFPVYELEDLRYYPLGELLFRDLLLDLKSAKRFIFLEYYIIDEGKMWGDILNILRSKVLEGVDVRLIYDDFGTIGRLPGGYCNRIRKFGIKCMVFNRFFPMVNMRMSNRTHRKMTVIDGEICYTGGINIADEYINVRNLIGHWKDTGVRLKGACVDSFTAMFLQMWSIKNRDAEDLEKFFESNNQLFESNGKLADVSDNCADNIRHDEGAYKESACSLDCIHTDDYSSNKAHAVDYSRRRYVLPFSDAPCDDINLAETMYLSMIYKAKDYVYICTPYLILDNEMKVALRSAALSGVNVQILVPHRPDKLIPFWFTKAFYSELIPYGVKIHEYLPGFIHAKSIVCDDRYAIVGTTNMDFRSFYLNYECGAYFYDEELALQIKQDFLDTLKECKFMTLKSGRVNIFIRTIRALLRMFAPLF